MDKITELKQYAREEFEKRKDFPKLKRVKGVILEAIDEIIENYSQYVDEHSIDKALRVNYKVKIYNEKDAESNGVYVPLSVVFNKYKKEVYGEKGTIIVYYPVDEYSEASAELKDEFDVKLNKKQSKSFKDYIVDMEPLKIRENTKKQEEELHNIKQNYFSILQHEILHSMCKKELVPYSQELEAFYSTPLDSQEMPAFYLFDGGFPLEMVNLKDESRIDYDKMKSFYLIQLHEGLTEYLAFSMKKKPVKRMAGFQNYGETYISPAYAPFVWFVGALNALNDNKLIDAYFKGKDIILNEKNDFESIMKNVKPFLSCLSNIMDFSEDIDFLNCSILDLDDLYIKLYDSGLSMGDLDRELLEIKENLNKEKDYEDIEESFYKTDRKKLDNIDDIVYYLAQGEIIGQKMREDIDELQKALEYEVEKFGDIFENTVEYLYYDYTKKLKSDNISNSQKQEFIKCLKNFVNFDYTWADYLTLDALDEYYFDFKSSIDVMGEKFRTKEKEEQIENTI